MIKEFRFSGIGGQGVILLGTVLSRALAIYEDLQTVQSMYYSASYRGGLCTTDVIVTDEELFDLTVHQPSYLVLTALKAFAANKHLVPRTAFSVVDTHSISVDEDCKKQWLSEVFLCDFFNLAKTNGINTRSSNMVMLGFIAKKSGIVSQESLLSALCDVQKRAQKDNRKAVALGFDL